MWAPRTDVYVMLRCVKSLGKWELIREFIIVYWQTEDVEQD